MGPMGPPMGWGGSTAILLLLGVAVLVVLALALIAVAGRGSRATTLPPAPRSPEDLLRERYARGEIGRQQYLEALGDILKDRYIRGELDLNEYEARLDVLLQQPDKTPHRELEQKE